MKIMEFDKKKQEMILKTESLNDLWALYNVIGSGDKVSAQTHRRIVLREGSKGERKPMRLTLNVESLSFHECSNYILCSQNPEQLCKLPLKKYRSGSIRM